jgi:hypothetical protein
MHASNRTCFSEHAAVQHSLNAELLQLLPVSSCKVGCPLCAQMIFPTCENGVTSRKYFPLP